MDCAHDGYHSFRSQYDPEQGVLKYLRVCEGCGQALAEVLRQDYRPDFDPDGNDNLTGPGAPAA